MVFEKVLSTINKHNLNHQIRGIEAQKDALYVSEICDEMGITYFLKSIDVPK